jgi:nucleoporin NUP159
MAFSSFGNAGNTMGGSAAGAGGVTQGPDLALIQTEGLGFLSIAGDAKISLTSQWSPAPAPTASLLSIAPRKGLVAAAGPDAIAISTTEAVRKAFKADKVGDSATRPFQPQLKLPLPLRICQLAFTADENHLIISAEQGGGLAVYDVQALLQGATETSFQIPTNGEALRALVPNPSPETGELCAVVTEQGNLLMANMKERGFVSGPNGQILKTQVSCAAWSTKGKQLVVGFADGTIHQMTPQGEVKAQIPKPPGLDGSYFGESC